MNAKEINKTRNKLQQTRPLVHCITNPISINQCANAVLAVSASPMMAEHPLEAAQITETARAVMFNIGNITDVRMQSIKISAKAAQKNGIPFIIDVVGASCSSLRRNFVTEFLTEFKPSVIKGNYSEIAALDNPFYNSIGVDADSTVNAEKVCKAAKMLAKRYNSIILASGKTDIVTDGNTIVCVHNGTPQLASVTGTGCLQGALCAAFLSVADAFKAAVTGCTVLGICGELSQTEKGSGSFLVNLMDNLSVLSDADVENLLKIEVKTDEKL